MRAGDTVHGYRLLDDFRVVGAGLSEWTFAERGGRVYFMKRFLAPTYPDDAAPGSPRTKARKRARCAAFEAHHLGIQAAMAPLTSYGGNLIATLDFFRDGAKYYKVTEKVDVAGLEPADVAKLGFPAQLVLLKTVAHSLKILHDLHIVHSDLKPSNVMIKRTELGYTTKLIDFDSSYIVGDPPPPEDIVGTMNYYSPELVTYIQGGGEAATLSEASDIFALGLIYTEYLTAVLPVFDTSYSSAAIAVLNGAVLRVVDADTPASVTALVERMLLPVPAERPTVGEVHSALMGHRSNAPTVGRAPLPTRAVSVGRAPQRLGGSSSPRGVPAAPAAPLRSTRPAGPAATPTVAPSRASTLRGKGLRLAADAVRRTPAASRSEPATPPPPDPSPPGAHGRPESARGAGRRAGPGAVGQTDRQARQPATTMSAAWQCAVCETVNHGGRTCSACGAAMTLRSAAVTSARGRIAPVTPPAPAPLPEPVRRAINREPVDEDWDYDNPTVHMIPIPGGCLFTSSPRRRVDR